MVARGLGPLGELHKRCGSLVLRREGCETRLGVAVQQPEVLGDSMRGRDLRDIVATVSCCCYLSRRSAGEGEVRAEANRFEIASQGGAGRVLQALRSVVHTFAYFLSTQAVERVAPMPTPRPRPTQAPLANQHFSFTLRNIVIPYSGLSRGDLGTWVTPEPRS